MKIPASSQKRKANKRATKPLIAKRRTKRPVQFRSKRLLATVTPPSNNELQQPTDSNQPQLSDDNTQDVPKITKMRDGSMAVNATPLIDYTRLKSKAVIIPEIELGMTKLQLTSLDYLLYESMEKLTPEEQNAVHIAMLKQKAEDLKREYANNPQAKEYVKVFQRDGLKADILARNQKAYIGQGFHAIHKMTTKNAGGYTLDNSKADKAQSILQDANITQDTPIDSNAPTPLAHAGADKDALKAINQQRAARRRAKNHKPAWYKYYELTKPRISQLVAVTGAWGYFSVGNEHDWKNLGLLTLGTISLSSAASIINQVRETDVDAKMTRTMSRPLVTGSISLDSAKKQALAYAAMGTALLTPLHTMVPVLGLSNVLLYGGLYTSLKRTTAFNTEIGALVGALPPMMGYFAALNQGQPWDTNLTALLYPAAMMIAWQIQHVMLICARRADEYNASGLVMQCKDDPGLKKTVNKGIAWVGISTALAAAPFFTGQADLTQLFAVYIWALYAIPYVIAMKKQDQKQLGRVLLAGYAVLGITIALSLQANLPLDPFQHLITDGPVHPTPLPDQPPSLFDVMIRGEGRPKVDADAFVASQVDAQLSGATSTTTSTTTTTTTGNNNKLASIDINMQDTSAISTEQYQQQQQQHQQQQEQQSITKSGQQFANMLKNFFKPRHAQPTQTDDL